MTQENKDLLLKDLCTRLNTNLVCFIYRVDDQGVGYRDEILSGYCKGDIWNEFYFGDNCDIGIDNVSKIKPYLFPLESMTEEQKSILSLCNAFIEPRSIELKLNFYNEQHIDYRGLIEKGLAIDATNLNIY